MTAHSGESFSTVSAEWVVPKVTQVPIESVKTTDISEWVGIDGFNSADVCQAGVMEVVHTSANGQQTITCSAWDEWYPAVSQNIPAASFHVKPGDTVKAGDVLMVEDTDQANAELAVLKAGADATGKIDEATVTIVGKSKLVDMYTKLSNGNYSGVELINAELDRDVAIARKKQAEEDHQEAVLAYQRQLVKIQHMSLRSPIDGVVESVSLYAGEPVDANADKQGAAYVVSNDPLWIEFHLDAGKAGKLSMSDPVEAAFPDAPDHWISGQIIFLDPVVEYVGQTRTVRVSIPNPDHRPSGLPMMVRLPQKVADDGGAVGTAQP